eukprot:888563-Pyramimonas_sp.AAC.1
MHGVRVAMVLVWQWCSCGNGARVAMVLVWQWCSCGNGAHGAGMSAKELAAALGARIVNVPMASCRRVAGGSMKLGHFWDSCGIVDLPGPYSGPPQTPWLQVALR